MRRHALAVPFGVFAATAQFAVKTLDIAEISLIE